MYTKYWTMQRTKSADPEFFNKVVRGGGAKQTPIRIDHSSDTTVAIGKISVGDIRPQIDRETISSQDKKEREGSIDTG